MPSSKSQSTRVKLPTVKVLSHRRIKSTMYIKSSTPFMSAVKKIDKMLKICPQYVTVLGMGKAVSKTLAVACYFQERMLRVQVRTTTVDVLDKITKSSESGNVDSDADSDSDSDPETELKKRTITGIEVLIYK